MTYCKECGQRLSLFGGYNHPILGKSTTICTKCYNEISTISDQWGQFVQANPRTVDYLGINKQDLKHNFKKTVVPIMNKYGMNGKTIYNFSNASANLA